MLKSIFDSKEEEKIFRRLKTYWGKYVDVFPQLPPRNVFGYNEIVALNETDSMKKFLLNTSFDFVVCDLSTHAPLLIVEFDGMSGGYSKEGKYFAKPVPQNDPYRELKMLAKLRTCEHFLIPIIVISYEECSLLKESEEMITILDVIISDAVEKEYFSKDYNKYLQILTEAYEFGGAESAEMASIEIDCLSEFNNPIKRKIREMTKKFPIWQSQILFPQPDEFGYLKGTFSLTSGLQTTNDKMFTKKLLSVDISMRQTETFKTDSTFLFNTVGEYCLARKAEKILGYDWRVWKEAVEKIEWTKY